MSEVVEKYFSILKGYFGDLLDWVSRKGYSESESIRATMELYSPTIMKTMMESLHQELLNLDWTAQENTVARLGGLKTAYLGHAYMYSKSPTMTFDFLKKTGLYNDTIIINDPLLSELVTWQKRGAGDVLSFHLVAQWALSLLTIEDLFSPELNPPICILAASEVLSFERRNLSGVFDRFIEENLVPSYASDLFGKSFPSSKELWDFLCEIKDFNEFIAMVQKPQMLTRPNGEPFDQNDFLAMKEYYRGKYNAIFSLPNYFWLLLRGRYGMVAHDLVLNGNITSDFITDFKGMWSGLLWLIKKDNELTFEHLKVKPISKDMLIMSALQEEELKWLGNIPLEKVKELRQRGELQELRDILGKNVRDIANVSDEEFVEVGRQVKYNLDQAFKKHDAEVKDLNEKYKRKYGIDVASLVVSGSLGIASSLFPPIALATGIVGSGSIIKTVGDFLEKRDKRRDLQKKPVAMLFDARKLGV